MSRLVIPTRIWERMYRGAAVIDNDTSYNASARYQSETNVLNGTYSKYTLGCEYRPTITHGGTLRYLFGHALGAFQAHLPASTSVTRVEVGSTSNYGDYPTPTVGAHVIDLYQFDGTQSTNATRLRVLRSEDGAPFTELVASGFTGTIPATFTVGTTNDLTALAASPSVGNAFRGFWFGTFAHQGLLTDFSAFDSEADYDKLVHPLGYLRYLRTILTASEFASLAHYVVADFNATRTTMVREAIGNPNLGCEPGTLNAGDAIDADGLSAATVYQYGRLNPRIEIHPAFMRRVRGVELGGTNEYFESAAGEGHKFFGSPAQVTLSETTIAFQYQVGSALLETILGADAIATGITIRYVNSFPIASISVLASDTEIASFDLDQLDVGDLLTGVVYIRNGSVRLWLSINRQAPTAFAAQSWPTATTFTTPNKIRCGTNHAGALYGSGVLLDVVCPGSAQLSEFAEPRKKAIDWCRALATNFGEAVRYSPWGEGVIESWLGFGRHVLDDATATTGLIRNLGEGDFAGVIGVNTVVGDLKDFPLGNVTQSAATTGSTTLTRASNTGGTASDAALTVMLVVTGNMATRALRLGGSGNGSLNMGFDASTNQFKIETGTSNDTLWGPITKVNWGVLFFQYAAGAMNLYRAQASTGTIVEVERTSNIGGTLAATLNFTGQISLVTNIATYHRVTGWRANLTAAQMRAAVEFVDGERVIPRDVSSYLTPWFDFAPSLSASPTTQWDDLSGNANHLTLTAGSSTVVEVAP